MARWLRCLAWCWSLALLQPIAHAQVEPLAALQAQLDSNSRIRAFLIGRGDRQVFGHYRPDTTPTTLLNVMSVTKSVVALLAGIAADRGLLALDEPLSAFFPEEAKGEHAARLSRVTLRHMLMMSSGFDRRGLDTDTDYGDFAPRLYSRGLLQHALARELVAQPGSRFYYSNIDSQLVAMAVARRLTVPFKDFARDELFGPVGIGSFEWATGQDGVVDGAAGLRISAPGLLRLGQLMRDGGAWQGRQVVSRHFAAEAVRRQVATDLPPRGPLHLWGYGYLWWTSSTPGDDRPAFYAAGYGGQFIYVVPALDVVIVAVTDPVSREVAAKTAAIIRDYGLPAAR